MNAANDLDRLELRALLHFYAESGVDWLIEDEPVDRFAQFAAQKAAHAAAKNNPAARQPAPPAQAALGDLSAILEPA